MAKKKAHYKWKVGSRLKRGQAQATGEALDRISRNTDLNAENVVEAASKKKHVLHQFFEWNDSAAAKEHRLEQARSLIRSVVVICEDASQPGYDSPYRAFVTLTEKEERGTYVCTAKALSNKQERARQVARAKKEAREWRNRWRHLTELADAFAAIDEL